MNSKNIGAMPKMNNFSFLFIITISILKRYLLGTHHKTTRGFPELWLEFFRIDGPVSLSEKCELGRLVVEGGGG